MVERQHDNRLTDPRAAALYDRARRAFAASEEILSRAEESLRQSEERLAGSARRLRQKGRIATEEAHLQEHGPESPIKDGD
jgi:hypothetical protein